MPTKDAGQLAAGPVLPQSTRNLLGEIRVEHRHAGLQLDKLSSAGEQENQRAALEAVTGTRGDKPLLRTLIERRNTDLIF